MQMLLRLLHRDGELISPQQLEATDWTVGRLESGSVSVHWPRRCLVFLALQSIPGEGVIAELHRPTIERIDLDHIEVRGFERVRRADGRIAAVAQDWRLKHRPNFGALGNRSPLNKQFRDMLDQPPPPPI